MGRRQIGIWLAHSRFLEGPSSEATGNAHCQEFPSLDVVLGSSLDFFSHSLTYLQFWMLKSLICTCKGKSPSVDPSWSPVDNSDLLHHCFVSGSGFRISFCGWLHMIDLGAVIKQKSRTHQPEACCSSLTWAADNRLPYSIVELLSWMDGWMLKQEARQHDSHINSIPLPNSTSRFKKRFL